jgi:hypothetical protein
MICPEKFKVQGSKFKVHEGDVLRTMIKSPIFFMREGWARARE